MQGAEERRVRRIGHTPQGGASEGNAADDILMVDQGKRSGLTTWVYSGYIRVSFMFAPCCPYVHMPFHRVNCRLMAHSRVTYHFLVSLAKVETSFPFKKSGDIEKGQSNTGILG
jgi:hypothetical protein